jgi:hypothetical protein
MVQFRAKVGEKEYALDVAGDARIGEAKMQLEQLSGSELMAAQQKWIYQVYSVFCYLATFSVALKIHTIFIVFNINWLFAPTSLNRGRY